MKDQITPNFSLEATAPKTIKRSEALAGEPVTTYSLEYGAVGLGWLVNGVVYRTTGNGYAALATRDAFPMDVYRRDGGKGYENRVAELFGGQCLTGSLPKANWRLAKGAQKDERRKVK